MSTTEPQGVGDAHVAGLAEAVLDAEAERERLQTEAQEQVLFPDDLLPGVGSEQITLRDGLKVGGMATFIVLLLLNSLDELESAALGVLAPDIRDSLNVSNGTIVFLASAASAFLILGAVPMGLLADRVRRPPVIGWASLVFGVFVAACGFVTSAFQLFFTRLGVGIAKANTGPVHGSLLADTYPIGVRGRISSLTFTAGQLTAALSPVLVAGIASLAGGRDGWRWPFILLGVPIALVAWLAFRLPEAPRGQFEKKDVLGEVIEDEKPAPISMEASFARLKQVKTLRTVVVAFSALGFGLFSRGVLANLFLKEEYGTKTLERGVLGTIGGIGLILALPLAGRAYDARFRRDPSRALRLLGLMILPAAVLLPAQYFMPNAILFTIVGIPQGIMLFIALTMVGPVLQSIVPYRLRGMGGALGSIYIFLIGATGGAVLAALLSDAIGPRGAVLVISIPSTVIGGYLIIRSSQFIRNDLSLVVAELQEELEEHNRQLAEPDTIPALQINHVDYSYGPVQVLFDVGLEVRRGEILALLGTNGAGKSTVLRAIAGLGTPSRGVVRLDGRNITYTTPEQRAHLGIHILIGGKGVFSAMTVRDNLEMSGYIYRKDEADFEGRIARALELFPALAEKQGQAASTLSGGQQQMLALAMTLLHDPKILAIDELSLGLAPLLVQELLGVIERLKSEGMTIILVEQSLNVALSVADRAVFLEKGQVRFSGPAAELADRDDLARAVFLGTEGG